MLDTFQFTFRLIRKRPLRTLLTILQLALAVWIVAIILSLNIQSTAALTEANSSVLDSLARLSISQIKELEGGGKMISGTSNLRYSDLERLLASEFIEDAFVFQSRWQESITVGDLHYQVSQSAEVTSSFAQATKLEMLEGSFFTQSDQEQQNPVVVISEVIKEQLFPNQPAVGKKIKLGGFTDGKREFTIIGVYKRPSALLGFMISESYLLFPLGVANPWFEASANELFHEIIIKAKPDKVYEAVEDAKMILADRAVEDMTVQAEYSSDASRFFQEQIKTITLFLGVFAFVATLVSALGILSIMLVSVIERTREIGLRKALGASRSSITWQILNESFVFSVLGGALGLIAAYFSAERLIDLLLQEITYPSLTGVGGLHPIAIVVSFGLVIFVGQVFGLYPAIQGAKMTPVSALQD